MRTHRFLLAACVLSTIVAPLPPPTAAARDAEPKRERGAPDPCERLVDVPGLAKGLHKRCGALGGGSGVARGDFNGDGVGDLAVGIPDENVGSVVDAGAVQIIYGSAANGLTSTGTQVITQDTFLVADRPEAEVGGPSTHEFRADNPFSLYGGTQYEYVGRVFLFKGTGSGLQFSEAITQDMAGGTRESGDQFGKTLAFGDFDGDGRDDLAIGAPGEDIGNPFVLPTYFPDAGLVHVLYGSSSAGVGGGGTEIWHQDSSGVPGANEAGDRFGYSLSAWNFGRSSHRDLAIGVPYDDINGFTDAGQVTVLYGSSGGLSTAGVQSWHQGLLGGLESHDRFGKSMY